jgi:hypothetical protein
VLFAAALRWRYRGRSFGFAIDGVRIVLPQVLDDGRLTDGQGRTVDFRNTLIVLTSNLGSEALASLPDGADVSVARAAVMAAVRDAFRPEFLNRLDEILLFRRLSRDDMKGIVAIQLERLKQLLADRKITSRGRRCPCDPVIPAQAGIQGGVPSIGPGCPLSRA